MDLRHMFRVLLGTLAMTTALARAADTAGPPGGGARARGETRRYGPRRRPSRRAVLADRGPPESLRGALPEGRRPSPSSQTSFAVLYDDQAIYVGVWADDPNPSKIRAQLTRRDVDALADAILVGFD